MTFRVQAVVDLICPVGKRNNRIHELLSVLSGANEKAGRPRNVKNGFVLARRDSPCFQLAEFVVLGRGALRRRLLM